MRKPFLKKYSGISKRQCVPEAREGTISFDLPTDNDQHHQLELLRKGREIKEMGLSYLRTRNFIGKNHNNLGVMFSNFASLKRFTAHLSSPLGFVSFV